MFQLTCPLSNLCLNLSCTTSEYTKIKVLRLSQNCEVYTDTEQAFSGDADLRHISSKGFTTQRTTSCQECSVSDTRVSCPPRLSALIPRSACLQHWFPGSEQPNAPTLSWWDLKQAIRKSWFFYERKLNPPRASLFRYAHTCFSPRTYAKSTESDVL